MTLPVPLRRLSDDTYPHEKAKLPFVSYAVVDGNLVTGQNPGSAKATARKVAEVLEGGADGRRS